MAKRRRTAVAWASDSGDERYEADMSARQRKGACPGGAQVIWCLGPMLNCTLKF